MRKLYVDVRTADGREPTPGYVVSGLGGELAVHRSLGADGGWDVTHRRSGLRCNTVRFGTRREATLAARAVQSVPWDRVGEDGSGLDLWSEADRQTVTAAMRGTYVRV